MRVRCFSFLLMTHLMAAAGCAATSASPEGDGIAERDAELRAQAGVPGAWCRPIPACDAEPPQLASRSRWNHVSSGWISALGRANHRGRDLLVNPGDPQRVIAKFAYGIFDKDLKDEQVAVYLLRDCGGAWEYLGDATTTRDNQHSTEEGVQDSGGRIYFEIPPEKALGVGRHRIHLVVRGDLTSTDLFIEVVPPDAPLFVSDVDGTLTTTESEEFFAMLTGELPSAHPDAPEALQLLAAKGYHPMYLTARPEWLVARTREFLDNYSFPPGVVHTTLSLVGATGASAARYKTGELAALADRGLVPAWGFGNTSSDADAYNNADISPVDHRVFYQYNDNAHGGRRIDSYADLLDEIEALPDLCE